MLAKVSYNAMACNAGMESQDCLPQTVLVMTERTSDRPRTRTLPILRVKNTAYLLPLACCE